MQDKALYIAFWAAATVNIYEPGAVQKLLARAHKLAPSLSLRSAASAMWAMSRLRHQDDKVFKALAGRVAWHADHARHAAESSAQLDWEADTPEDRERAAELDSQSADALTVSSVPRAVAMRTLRSLQGGGHSLASLMHGDECNGTALNRYEDDNTPEYYSAGLSVALHAAAVLACSGDLPEVQHMVKHILLYGAEQRRQLSPNDIVNMCWSAAVLNKHGIRPVMAPLLRQALLNADKLDLVQLAQLAQVDAALMIETEWYQTDTWLDHGNQQTFLSQLYWLGATR